MMSIRLLLFSIAVTGCTAPPCTDPPTLVWPLGTGNGYEEVMTNANSGVLGTVSYSTGYTAIGMNSAMNFSGVADSFVEINVPNHASITNINGDYSIIFYAYFDNIQSGTILHYRSDTYNGMPTTDEIRELKITVSSGFIKIHYTDFGSVAFEDTPILASEWYSVSYEKDLNKDGPALYLNITGNYKAIGTIVKDKLTIFPGTIRIGADFDGTNPFSGRLACLQIVPCREAIGTTYDNHCATQPTTTTSTTTTERQTTTTTTEPTTTTTTEQPTTTTATEQPTTTTTTEQPTTTTTMEQPTTTTTTEQPTTTTTTEQPTTTTTTEQPTTTTTTEQPTTTTTTERLTTTSALPPITVPFSAAEYSPLYEVSDRCYRYTRTEKDVTFGNILDVIRTTTVHTVVACAKYCDNETLCFSFTVVPLGTGFECKIGIKAPLTTPLLGSMLYEL
ncbi:uncharacterized protein LOC123548007 [Mercenaria mercenaria]|uniref:uncharacterized protein LOC123548007 n=1 Tax=Mercenaria mercenaria TaxID=6596 RepID=UPI00234F4650|nr:uncharacterized protein LOC123548007 [Mercenaria mercenaria]